MTEYFNPFLDIIQFHKKYDISYDGKPRVLPDEYNNFRIKFMQEELDEYIEAASQATLELNCAELQSDFLLPPDEGEFKIELAKALDALVDLVYVALGTAYLHGFDFNTAWQRVHEANMKKIRVAKVEDSTRGSEYDVVKPAGWVPPSHSDLIEDHAHQQAFLRSSG